MIVNIILKGIIFLTGWRDIHFYYLEIQLIFHILILYPATLLKLFISSHRLSVDYLRFYIYKCISSVDREFYFILSKLDSFHFFFCPNTLVSPEQMLNRSGKSKCPCLVLDLKGKSSSFPSLSIMLAMRFS